MDTDDKDATSHSLLSGQSLKFEYQHAKVARCKNLLASLNLLEI